jgi:hypothetical protein
MRMFSLLIAAAACLACAASSAYARTTYDGSWDLLFVTQRGACDPSYSFTVNIANGVVTHPNLVKFRGYVARSGTVHASVTVQDKYASGAGRLSGASGRGHGAATPEAAAVQALGPRNAIDTLQGPEGCGLERGTGVLCIATPFKNGLVRGCIQYLINNADRLQEP